MNIYSPNKKLLTIILTILLYQPQSRASVKNSEENLSISPRNQLSDPEEILNVDFKNGKQQEKKLERELNLSSQDINSHNLNEALKKNSLNQKVDLLYLNKNNIQTQGLRLIDLSVLEGFRLLSFRECRIKEIPDEFIEQLKRLNNLKTLNLSNNFIDQDSIKSLFPDLQKTYIKNLHLSGNALGNDGVLWILKHLKENFLEKLYISNVNVDIQIIKPLAQAISKNSIEELDISDHEFGDQGFADLIEGLQMSKLKILYAHQCDITQFSSKTLDLFQKMTELQEIYLYGNNLEEKDQEKYLQFFKAINIEIKF